MGSMRDSLDSRRSFFARLSSESESLPENSHALDKNTKNRIPRNNNKQAILYTCCEPLQTLSLRRIPGITKLSEGFILRLQHDKINQTNDAFYKLKYCLLWRLLRSLSDTMLTNFPRESSRPSIFGLIPCTSVARSENKFLT